MIRNTQIALSDEEITSLVTALTALDNEQERFYSPALKRAQNDIQNIIQRYDNKKAHEEHLQSHGANLK